MRTKCAVHSVITFDDLGLVLQVDRRDRWAMLVHLASGDSLGIYIRDGKGLHWDSNGNDCQPPQAVWATIATMI